MYFDDSRKAAFRDNMFAFMQAKGARAAVKRYRTFYTQNGLEKDDREFLHHFHSEMVDAMSMETDIDVIADTFMVYSYSSKGPDARAKHFLRALDIADALMAHGGKGSLEKAYELESAVKHAISDRSSHGSDEKIEPLDPAQLEVIKTRRFNTFLTVIDRVIDTSRDNSDEENKPFSMLRFMSKTPLGTAETQLSIELNQNNPTPDQQQALVKRLGRVMECAIAAMELDTAKSAFSDVAQHFPSGGKARAKAHAAHMALFDAGLAHSPPDVFFGFSGIATSMLGGERGLSRGKDLTAEEKEDIAHRYLLMAGRCMDAPYVDKKKYIDSLQEASHCLEHIVYNMPIDGEHAKEAFRKSFALIDALDERYDEGDALMAQNHAERMLKQAPPDSETAQALKRTIDRLKVPEKQTLDDFMAEGWMMGGTPNGGTRKDALRQQLR